MLYFMVIQSISSKSNSELFGACCQLVASPTLGTQSVPLATSPKVLSSKYSFGIVKIIQIQYLLARIIKIVYLG